MLKINSDLLGVPVEKSFRSGLLPTAPTRPWQRAAKAFTRLIVLEIWPPHIPTDEAEMDDDDCGNDGDELISSSTKP